MNVYPVAPVATAAAVAAVTHQWEAQKQHDEAHATEVLREAVQEALEAGVSHASLLQNSYASSLSWRTIVGGCVWEDVHAEQFLQSLGAGVSHHSFLQLQQQQLQLHMRLICMVLSKPCCSTVPASMLSCSTVVAGWVWRGAYVATLENDPAQINLVESCLQ
jgi:hypothetical protein